jgi:hypothetical protein
MHFAVLLFASLVATASPLHAETIGGNPGPQHNYVCPHADGQATGSSKQICAND